MIPLLKTVLVGAWQRLAAKATDRIADRVLDELADTDPMPMTHADAQRILEASKAFDTEPDTERSPEPTHNPRLHEI